MSARKRRRAEYRAHNKHRNFVLVDIENYIGHSVLTRFDVEAARRDITSRFDLKSNDTIVIGTSHGENCYAAKLAWNDARHVLKRGHNGADIALVDASKDYDITSYEKAYILSGDGYFADLADKLSSAGTEVVVARGAGGLSHKFDGLHCAFA